MSGLDDALLIVKPDTLLKWHRQGFRLLWRRKSKPGPRKPRLPKEALALIKQMAVENRCWGAKRIRDELAKLTIQVSRQSVRRYMKQARQTLPPPSAGQGWATFLANHAHATWACDFLQTYDVLFRAIFVFVIVELESRRVVYWHVTRQPSDVWTAPQLREATPFGQAPRFLVRDNDRTYGVQFAKAAHGSGIEVLRTPIAAPKANAICERFLGTLRRECLDHVYCFLRSAPESVVDIVPGSE